MAVLVQMPGGIGRFAGNDSAASHAAADRARPRRSPTELRAYARAGIGAVQLVLDPITLESIEAFGAVLELLDAD